LHFNTAMVSCTELLGRLSSAVYHCASVMAQVRG